MKFPLATSSYFLKYIVHEVIAAKQKKGVSIRLFTGWRTTASDVSVVENLDSLLEDQAVIPLKSGQFPPMYATLHWTNWVSKIEEFSKCLNPKCVEAKIMGSGNRKGSAFSVVHRHMKSLKHYGFKRYPAYSARERSIHTPNKVWKVRPIGKKDGFFVDVHSVASHEN